MRAVPVACLAVIALAGTDGGGAETLGAAAQEQDARAVFRASTQLIVQSVTVSDRDGRPIEGLTARDFQVTEDDVPQAVSFAELQRLRDEPAPSAPAAPERSAVDAPARAESGIAIPAPGSLKYQDRRLVVLYFDLSSMRPAEEIRAHTAALRYLDTGMRPADLIAIMTYEGGGVRVRQDFTGDRERLRTTMRTLAMAASPIDGSFPDGVEEGTGFGQDDAEFRMFNTDRQLSALQTAVTMLQPLPEQKTVIYFASGLRLNGSDNQAQLRATVNAAIRANATLNPIDARGLVASAPLGDAARRSTGIGMFAGGLASAWMTRLQQSQDTLYAIAKDTGGVAMFDSNDLAAGIEQATRTADSYYLVGYQSSHASKDGRYRRVRIRVNGHPDAVLRYREGYFGDREFARFSSADKERQLEEALRLDNPITDIGLAMEVNYFQIGRAEYFVPVHLRIPGSELSLARRRGAAQTVIDVIGEVKDEYGITYQNVRDRLSIRLDEAEASQLATRPLTYETGFTLLPGTYVVKVLARDATTGRIGTYQTTFTIPNLEREHRRLRISTVVLGSLRVPLRDALHNMEQQARVDAVNPLVHDDEKLIPSVTRVFSRSRSLYVFLQTYPGDPDAAKNLVTYVSFYRAGVKAFETTPLVNTDTGGGPFRAIPIRFGIPLERLHAGEYECQVTVLDPDARRVAFWRAPILLQ